MAELRVAVAGGAHGGPGLSDYTGALAEELASNFDVVRYQQRGLSPSLEIGPYDIETNVADAIAVLDALALERVWLTGHSNGGPLAMHIAVAAPERVRGLSAINTRGAVPDGGLGPMVAALQNRYEAHYGRPLGRRCDDRGGLAPEILRPAQSATVAGDPPQPRGPQGDTEVS